MAFKGKRNEPIPPGKQKKANREDVAKQLQAYKKGSATTVAQLRAVVENVVDYIGQDFPTNKTAGESPGKGKAKDNK